MLIKRSLSCVNPSRLSQPVAMMGCWLNRRVACGPLDAEVAPRPGAGGVRRLTVPHGLEHGLLPRVHAQPDEAREVRRPAAPAHHPHHGRSRALEALPHYLRGFAKASAQGRVSALHEARDEMPEVGFGRVVHEWLGSR